MRGYLLKMLLSIGFLLLFSTKFVDVTIGERLYEYPLETAWKATGIPLQEVDTEAWLKLNDRRVSIYELKEIAGGLRKKLKLRLKTEMIIGEEKDFCYLSFEGIQGNGTNVTVTIQSLANGEFAETQLGVNTIYTGNMNNLREYIRDMRGQLAHLGSDLNFNVVFIGERSGRIPPLLIRELSGRAFRKINAELVDSAFEDGNSNQKAFSGLIKEAVEIDTHKINVEFDTRYDQNHNITQIILATPGTTGGV
ncbi:MAG: hypothetical protein GXY86_05250 [Firmicutes bacterium]|nr:hypothetical protein [Bacillota bacterium]